MEENLQSNLIERLTKIFNHLEEKLISMKTIHENLSQLMTLVSNTHENIIQNLNYVQILLNQQKENSTIVSTSSEDSLSINDNPQISDQLTTNIKSSKSVSFSLDQDLHHEQRKFIRTFEKFPKEKKTVSYGQVTTPINPALTMEYLRENEILDEPLTNVLTDIRIDEIEWKNGDYLRLINRSSSNDYDLTDHFIQQIIHSKLFCRFLFPFDTILRAGQTITIWCGRSKGIVPHPPHIFLWKEQKNWETKPECLTILAKPDGETIASFRNTQQISIDQSSSDILHIHSTRNSVSSDLSRTSSRNSFVVKENPNDFYGNRKPPFAHSTTNPIHPDYNATIVRISNDHRSQIPQQRKYSQLLHRPKSSPFANYSGCRQDLISFNVLRRQKQQTNLFN